MKDHIIFCVESNMPTKTVSCFPNNKPRITGDLKKAADLEEEGI